MDESTYQGGNMGKDHPIAWLQSIGKGRMWYTALGHTEESFTEPLMVKHLLGGIHYAAGTAAKPAKAD
jgi:type 1 glutamine amidotransferase